MRVQFREDWFINVEVFKDVNSEKIVSRETALKLDTASRDGFIRGGNFVAIKFAIEIQPLL